MAVAAVGDLWELIYDYIYAGQHTLFTLHYKLDSLSGTAPTLAAFIAAFRAEIDGLGDISQQLAACYVDEASNGLLSFQKIWPARYLKSSSAAGYPDGTNDGYAAVMPPNVAMALTLRADFAGPHFRGTKHLGCMGDNFITDGFISAAGQTAQAALGNVLITTVSFVASGTTCSLSPVILNRAGPSTSPTITNYIRGTTSRVQRRRTVGLGI